MVGDNGDGTVTVRENIARSACTCRSGRQEVSRSSICERDLSASPGMVMEREREEKGAPRE